MKVSIDWLREYIDFDCSLDTLADGLTMAGLEVEEVIKLSKEDFTRAGGSGTIDDIVFDSKVTPNRGDWLSMIGVAREAGPVVGGRVKMPNVKLDGSEPTSSDLIKIRIDDPDLCGRYVGIVVRNVEIKESPGWLKDRVIAAGMRPINNVVDITNFVMLELGQPLHAFDYNLLNDAQIVVRRAKPGETITSIDGNERRLEPDMLVIADSNRPVAIAGVMGGEDSEISRQTQDILIESANFNSVSIRRTSKRLGLVTESSYRFERGVDPSIAPLAAMRAAQLIHDLASGDVAKGIVDARPVPVEPLEIKVRPERVNLVLGTSITAENMARFLNSIDIETHLEDGILISQVPTFRPDITREIDMAEEVGRVYGYDKLDTTLPDVTLQGKDSPEGLFRNKIRRSLMACGAQEVLTHSMVEVKLAEIAGNANKAVSIRNPLSEELNSMRTMLAPNLLQVVARNQAYGTVNVSVFETGKVYFQGGSGRPDETLSVAGAMVGDLWRSNWSLPAEALQVDFFTCKGAVESLLGALNISGANYIPVEHPMLHPTRAAKVLVGDREIGILGEVVPAVSDALDVRGRAYIYELDFRALMELAPEMVIYQEPARYPALYRHMAVVVADDVKYAQLVELVIRSGKGLVEAVDMLDVYKGEQVGAGRRSLTLSVVFRSREKTLTDDEVNAVLGEIKEALAQKAGASFR
ncbi:MAG: phenylalanine--tRNA ligase subunit beta [Armatimonadota bacterium]|nr:phenylalanine--tRNA ligase subunit beta [bacterium]